MLMRLSAPIVYLRIKIDDKMKYYVTHFHIKCDDESVKEPSRDILAAIAGECGYETFMETDEGVDGYVQTDMYDEQMLADSISDFPIDGVAVTYSTEEVEDQNWNHTWEQEEGFEPIIIDHKAVIYDIRHYDENEISQMDEEIKIGIQARNAFGTGTHQTTRMILRRLLGMNLNGKKVLDCGCGTGILGIVASRLGADRVLGYDIDEWSSENAKHNASINGVGNLDVMLGDASVLDGVDEKFDVVIANINRNILINDMPAFKRHMKKDGCLILSGFYESDVPMLEKAAMDNAMSLKNAVTDEEWACALFAAN